MKIIKSTLSDLISIVAALLIIGVIIAPTLEKNVHPNPAAQESICVQDLYEDLLIRFNVLTTEHNRLLQKMAVQYPEIGP